MASGREPRARELSSTTARQNEAFAERFSALPWASAPEAAVPSACGSVRRSSVKFETKTPQEVEQISQRLAQVRRCHLDFLSGDGSREVLKAKEVSSPVRSARTRSQRLQQDFEDIDAGKLDAKSVFSKVVGADNRVNTKLLFFRDRLDLVLPAIEDRFLVHDSQRDCYTVDVLRLRAHHSQDDSRHEPSADLLEESLGPHHMSLDLSAASSWSQQDRSLTSRGRSQRSAAPSVETVEERSLRLARLARIREERMVAARRAAKTSEWDRRLLCLAELRARETRAEASAWQQAMLTTLAAACAMQELARYLEASKAMQELVNENVGHYAHKAKGHWQRAKNLVNQSVLESSKSLHDFRKVLHMRANRSKTAWQSWDYLLRVLKFPVRLRVRSRLTRSAQAIKQFIDGAWRGMHFRARVGVYLANVRLLQKAVRAAQRFRVNLQSFIYLPTLWELETQLLGEKLKAHLPKGYTRKKVAQHRQAWDLEGRVRVLQELAKERTVRGLRGLAEKQRQSAKARVREEPAARRRRGAMRADRLVDRQVIFSEFGEAIPSLAAGRQQQQAWAVANNVLDHYRLDIDTRRSVARTIFFQSLDRWKESNNKFAHERKRLNGLWQQWRLQVQALGPMQKEHWPPPPPHLDPPSEVYDVDTKKMKILIITGLAQSALGRSLFARDMRRVSAS